MDPLAELRLDDKVVIVTGATQGLGAGIARRCRALGARLVLTGRDAERGEAVRAELDAVFVPAELQDVDACRAVVAGAADAYGRVDGLVNAAGLSTRGTFDDTTIELWDRLFAVNVRAPFVLTQAAAPLMRKAGGGSVVNIITMSSHGGQPDLMAYSASKGALATLTRNLGYALTRDRIRVNGLNIGWTATEGEHAVQAERGGEDWLAEADASRPLGRLLRPEDVAPMVCHLLSDAAMMVTGSVMDYDQDVLGTHGEVPA
jgi:NAD(P)-dependent dehydrogenase (short-subunit alcohol dehydrogenase family)